MEASGLGPRPLGRLVGVSPYRVREWRRGVVPSWHYLSRLLTVAEGLGLREILMPAALETFDTGVVEVSADVVGETCRVCTPLVVPLSGTGYIGSMASESTPYWEVADELGRMGALEFTALCNDLLHAERLVAREPVDAVDTTANISAPDGGVDARTRFGVGTDFVPVDETVWQYKATNSGPADLAGC